MILPHQSTAGDHATADKSDGERERVSPRIMTFLVIFGSLFVVFLGLTPSTDPFQTPP
jgi:hypothetical protein